MSAGGGFDVAQRAQAFERGYPTAEGATRLADELFCHFATQAYLWAMPVLNLYAMKEGSERAFGKGYNVLPIWKRRLDAKTLITTPNSDVIYALGYLDLNADGPIVVEAPPGLQGVLDDFFQRPVRSDGEIDGKRWSGDVGLPGPDAGAGGKYLLLPPDFGGDVPDGYFAFRSRTYGVFVFWRGFFQDPRQLDGPVKVLEQTRIYPLGHATSAKPMRFPDASGVPVNMLPPRDHSAFELLKRFVDDEYVATTDMDMRGVLAAIGIAKGQAFRPDARTRELLDHSARCASELARYTAYVGTGATSGGKYYADRQWVNGFPSVPGTPEFTTSTYTDVRLRCGFFSIAYSTSPGMASNMPDVGAKYPTAFVDADGEYLRGDRSYRVHLPPEIPAKLFWSVALYDAETASGLDNGQRFPSMNSMDKPLTNPDGSVDIWLTPKSPGEGKNWIATSGDKGFFVCLRLYGPTAAFFEQRWKPDDITRL